MLLTLCRLGIGFLTLGGSALAETLETSSTLDQVIQYDQSVTGSAFETRDNLGTSSILDQVIQYAQSATGSASETPGVDSSAEQVTSVSQLSEVKPTDWTFQALQSLVERYGAIAGYPERNFRDNRVLTRYNFAAGLSTVIDRVNKLIADGFANKVSLEDLATLQRLQEEFRAELATVQGRVDRLEASTAELEANQFSTTTKLTGLLLVAVNAGAFSGDRIVDPRGVEIANEQPNATVLYRASLDIDTSFNGTDLLKLRMEAGSDRINDNASGLLEPTFGSVLDFSIAGFDEQFTPTRLNYTFTPLKDFKVSFGPVLFVLDYVDLNSYANISFQDFSTQALINNYLLFPFPAGAGAAIDWNPEDGPFAVRAVYLAGDGANPTSDDQRFVGALLPQVTLLFPNASGNSGLFGNPYLSAVELEYSPSKAFALRLIYSGGNVFENRFDVFGANFELALSDQFAIFGRYGNGNYQDTVFGDINPNYWMAGVSFRDLFAPGALAGIATGQPFIEKAVGNATQTNIEAFYNFPISDKIRVTPLVQVIIDPGNQKSNGSIVTGTLRAVFSF